MPDMNEATAKLISDLANKLGTTADHLWSVLIKQAPIAATWGIMQLFIDGAMMIILWIVARKMFMRAHFLENDDSQYANDTENKVIGLWIGGAIVAFIAVVFTIGFVCGDLGELQVTISGFLNPEYWALKQVMK
jgi:hypothetical protein